MHISIVAFRAMIMVTVHQPTTGIFESFDALVLLQRGGTVIPCLLMSNPGESVEGMAP